MRFCTTPMYLNKRLNERSRKTHRNVNKKGIQKCTSLNGNSMKIRDRPNGMKTNLEKQIIELSKLMGCDTRISTPTNGSIGDEKYDVIKRRGLSV